MSLIVESVFIVVPLHTKSASMEIANVPMDASSVKINVSILTQTSSIVGIVIIVVLLALNAKLENVSVSLEKYNVEVIVSIFKVISIIAVLVDIVALVEIEFVKQENANVLLAKYFAMPIVKLHHHVVALWAKSNATEYVYQS